MENNNSANMARVAISRIMMEPAVLPYMQEMAEKLPRTFAHSVDVAYLAGEVGYECELDYTDDIIRGGLLHDIGKLRVPHDLLTASRKLTPDERDILRNHAMLGYEMIAGSGIFSDIVKDVVKSHHERQDGSGYPEGKTGALLKKATKIITVCDMYDALTEQRPYRKAFRAYEALNIITDSPVDRSILKILKECPDR